MILGNFSRILEKFQFSISRHFHFTSHFLSSWQKIQIAKSREGLPTQLEVEAPKTLILANMSAKGLSNVCSRKICLQTNLLEPMNRKGKGKLGDSSSFTTSAKLAASFTSFFLKNLQTRLETSKKRLTTSHSVIFFNFVIIWHIDDIFVFVIFKKLMSIWVSLC